MFRLARPVLSSALLFVLAVFGQEPPPLFEDGRIVVEPRPDATFVFARFGTTELKLDLYLPDTLRADTAGAMRVPFVLWLHGGGWRGGSRSDPSPALVLREFGYAVASADYRLSQQAPWPAQLQDARAALRWLRGHADTLRLDTARAVAWGTSAGGHLAAMLGLTTPEDGIDAPAAGAVADSGAPPAPEGRVRAVVMYHAPTDFLEYHPRRWKPGSSVSQLLGCAVPDCPVRARRASPVAYATTDDPPVFMAHGTADSTVPVTQAWRMYVALRAAGIPAELAIVPGGDHGGPDFVSSDMIVRVIAFLDRAFARDSVAAIPPGT